MRLLVANQGWHEGGGEPAERARRLLGRLAAEPEVQSFLGVNRYHDQLWFNRECYGELLLWLARLAAVEIARDHGDRASELLADVWAQVEELEALEAASGYRLEGLVTPTTGTAAGDGEVPEGEPSGDVGGNRAADDQRPDRGGERCDE